MNPLPTLRTPSLIGVVAACMALGACGGGSGGSDSTSKPTAAVVPSGDPAASAASAAEADAAASAVTLEAQTTAESAGGEASAAGSATPHAAATTSGTQPAATSKAATTKQDSSPTTSSATATTGVSTRTTSNTARQADANSSTNASVDTGAQDAKVEAPTAKAMATTTATDTPGARCTVGETRVFGSCKALASIGFSHGETVSFWNTNPGVTGTISASCNNGVVTWRPGVCSDTTQAAGDKSTAQAKAVTSAVTLQAAATVPNLTALQTFVATPPYSVLTTSGLKSVPLIPYGGKTEVPRTHDFVGAFVNPTNKRPNAVTVQTPIVSNGVLQYVNLHEASVPPLTSAGSPGRASLEGGALKLAYLPNDPPSSEKLRTQVNSYPIPTHRTLTWDLSFKFGGDQPSEAWPTVKYTTSPILIWQIIQVTRGYPPIVLLVDTDPADSNKLMLILAWRGANAVNTTNRWTIAGLAKNQYHDLVIQANLDERDSQAGGQGQIRMWINGQLAGELNQRTLFPELDDTYRWAIALYQTNELSPIALTRVMKWRRARMMVSP